MMGSAMADNQMAICGYFVIAVVDQTQQGNSESVGVRFEILSRVCLGLQIVAKILHECANAG